MSKRYTFPLQKALDWYRQSLTVEQAALQSIVNEIAVLDRLKQSLERRQRSEHELLHAAESIFGKDLSGLAGYLAVIRTDLNRVSAEKRRQEVRLAAQRQQVAVHHRRVRLLEELEKRQKTEWVHHANAEQDSLASDVFLASMARESGRRDAGKEQNS